MVSIHVYESRLVYCEAPGHLASTIFRRVFGGLKLKSNPTEAVGVPMLAQFSQVARIRKPVHHSPALRRK